MKYLLQRLAGTHLDSDGSQLFKFERELPHKSNTPFILAVELQSGYGLYDFRTYIYNILFKCVCDGTLGRQSQVDWQSGPPYSCNSFHSAVLCFQPALPSGMSFWS